MVLVWAFVGDVICLSPYLWKSRNQRSLSGYAEQGKRYFADLQNSSRGLKSRTFRRMSNAGHRNWKTAAKLLVSGVKRFTRTYIGEGFLSLRILTIT